MFSFIAQNDSSSLKQLSGADMYNFHHSLVNLESLVEEEWRRYIEKALREVVERPGVLLNLLEEHHAILSGSWVLHTLLRNPMSTWLPDDLDITVHTDHFETFVKEFQVAFRAEEFFFPPSKYVDKTRKIKQVRHFKILVHGMHHDVDIIQSVSDAVTAITSYHSTIVMNYMTHNKLIIGYPLWTLQGYGIITVADEDINPVNSRAFTKYEKRGFVLQTNTDGFPQVDDHGATVIYLTETARCSAEELSLWRRLGVGKGFISGEDGEIM